MNTCEFCKKDIHPLRFLILDDDLQPKAEVFWFCSYPCLWLWLADNKPVDLAKPKPTLEQGIGVDGADVLGYKPKPKPTP